MRTASMRAVSFGPYVLDLFSAELRKFGTKIKMGEQPFQILRMLLENPGELVTREELRANLWANDTFVDFDHGLNSAVQRLRDCLSDSAASPRWIETLPRRGYRFIGQVTWQQEAITFEKSANSNGGSRTETADGFVVGTRVLLPQVGSQVEHAISEHRIGKKPDRRLRVMIIGAVAALAIFLVGIPIARQIKDARSARQALLIRSLAVLPLENLSGDPAQEYFVDGMTDDLITTLAKIPSLRVVSRTSVMQYKNVHRPLREIASELGVDGILEGSVRRVDNHVHVTAQLIYAASDSHIWAESYDRDLNSALSLPGELAQTIAKEVGQSSSLSSVPGRIINPEAYDAYLRGRYLWFASLEGGEYFQKAITLQPNYAAAWSGLSDYYSARGVAGFAPPNDVAALARQDAKKAVELDDSLPDAHNSMAAYYLFYDHDWKRADQESARAIDLDPNFAEGHHLRGYVLLALNRDDESLKEEIKAMELDRFVHPWGLTYALIHMRQFDNALNEALLRAKGQSQNADAHGMLAEAYWYKGMGKESAQQLEESLSRGGDADSATAVKRAFDHGGYKAVLEWQLDQLKKKAATGYVAAINFAYIYSRLKLKEETLRSLEQAYQEHSPRLVFLQHEPDFDFVHSSPRYRAIVKEVGLPSNF